MKKITLFLICILQLAICINLNAQSIDWTKDGKHYYIASPNGRYYTGTISEGPACFFDADKKIHVWTDSTNVLVSAVNNDGIACGAYLGKPAIWVRGGEWKELDYLTTISNQPIIGGEIMGMSADATKFIALISYGDSKKIPVYYEVSDLDNWDNDEAWAVSTLPTPKKEDLLYNMDPQFIQVCGMNYDGTRILGRYMLKDGKREVPFIWEKDEKGEWSYRFVGVNCCFVEDVVNGTIKMLEREDFDNVMEYDAFRESVETGVRYDLTPFSLFAWTGSGKYVPVCVVVWEGDYEAVQGGFVNYAAVLDIDNDSLIVFRSVPNAGTVSANDKGEVMIYTPHMSTYRDSYVATIEKPSEAISLLEYTKQRTNGLIDLAQYMNYQRGGDNNKPEMQVATGSPVWANEGNAYVTFNYDEWNETLIPHSYIVRFDAPVDAPVIEIENLEIYPNPTSGIIYFEKQLENIAIYDITGRQVYAQSFAEQSIDLSSLNVGTYVFSARSAGENIITKVMITR